MATRWIQISMIFLHIWASAFVVALCVKTTPSELIGAAFSTCTFGIGATLIILLFDKASDAIINRIAGGVPSAPPPTTIQTAGNVIVQPGGETKPPEPTP